MKKELTSSQSTDIRSNTEASLDCLRSTSVDGAGELHQPRDLCDQDGRDDLLLKGPHLGAQIPVEDIEVDKSRDELDVLIVGAALKDGAGEGEMGGRVTSKAFTKSLELQVGLQGQATKVAGEVGGRHIERHRERAAGKERWQKR